jgi:hypothetical protein
VSDDGDQAEAERSEVHRTEVYRTEVRRAGEADAPEEFLWEGQVHRVQAVLDHHPVPEGTEQGAEEGATSPVAESGEVWRVRASAGRHGYRGVFDLRFDWTAGRWTVTRISMLEGES